MKRTRTESLPPHPHLDHDGTLKSLSLSLCKCVITLSLSLQSFDLGTLGRRLSPSHLLSFLACFTLRLHLMYYCSYKINRMINANNPMGLSLPLPSSAISLLVSSASLSTSSNSLCQCDLYLSFVCKAALI